MGGAVRRPDFQTRKVLGEKEIKSSSLLLNLIGIQPSFHKVLKLLYKVKTIKKEKLWIVRNQVSLNSHFPAAAGLKSHFIALLILCEFRKGKVGKMNVVRRQIGDTLNNHEGRVGNEYMFFFRARSTGSFR